MGIGKRLMRFSSPKNHDLLALVKGARNGLVYGTKVRTSPSLSTYPLIHNDTKLR